MLQHTLNTAEQTDTRELFKNLDLLSHELVKRGTPLSAYTQESFQKFQSLPADAQRAIADKFQVYAEIVQEAISNTSGDLPALKEETLERDLLNVCADKLEIVFSSEIFQKIAKEDVVEIYTTNLIQVYRSFRFFDLCSYNLLDLLTYEWHELYERSLQVNAQLMQAGEILATRPYSLLPVSLRDIPKHLMREKFSSRRHSFFIEFKEMYPVYTLTKELYGYIMVQGANRAPAAQTQIAFI